MMNDKKCFFKRDIKCCTAIQVAALSDDERILELCRNILNENAAKSSIQLKSSALSAIGILRDRKSLDILEKYSVSSDIRLTTAARNAINNIKNNNPKRVIP